MHHLTPRAPPICRKDHPCIEGAASHFQLFPLTIGARRWARAGRAVPPLWLALPVSSFFRWAAQIWVIGAATLPAWPVDRISLKILSGGR
jgi:hypothetical protein